MGHPMTNAELIAVLRHYAATPWQMAGPGLLMLAAKRLEEVQEVAEKPTARRRARTKIND